MEKKKKLKEKRERERERKEEDNHKRKEKKHLESKKTSGDDNFSKKDKDENVEDGQPSKVNLLRISDFLLPREVSRKSMNI